MIKHSRTTKKGNVINCDKYERTDFTRHRCYAIFARDPKTGKLSGYVEHSFSMGWDEKRVNIWRSHFWQNTYSRRELAKRRTEHALAVRQTAANLQLKYPHLDVFCTRVGSDKCPVKIDWSDFWTNTCRNNGSKYNYRNLKFTLK
ncbi:hypothetical protein VPHD479_0382 [Vibrio phage D479]